MKKISSMLFVIALFAITSNSFAQPSWLPKPVQSPYFDVLEGTWESESFVFMGGTTKDHVTYTKILNGQYMQVDVKRTDDKGFTYEAREIITPAKDGSLSGSFYDIFGKGGIRAYKTSQEGDKTMIGVVGGNGSNDMVIEGNTMTSYVTFKMDSDMNMPEQHITIIYKKQ